LTRSGDSYRAFSRLRRQTCELGLGYSCWPAASRLTDSRMSLVSLSTGSTKSGSGTLLSSKVSLMGPQEQPCGCEHYAQHIGYVKGLTPHIVFYIVRSEPQPITARRLRVFPKVKSRPINGIRSPPGGVTTVLLRGDSRLLRPELQRPMLVHLCGSLWKWRKTGDPSSAGLRAVRQLVFLRAWINASPLITPLIPSPGTSCNVVPHGPHPRSLGKRSQ